MCEARSRRRVGACARLAALMAIVVGGVLGGLPLASAAAAPFQRGDVFLGTDSGLQEYSPSGQLQQTIPGVTPAAGECFDPSGKHLVVPGVGLFDSSGNLLPSDWASVPGAPCVADGFGHVYVSTPVAPLAIGEYSLAGKPIQSFIVGPLQGFPPLSLALAPDECTIYLAPAIGSAVYRFNACTDNQEGMFQAATPEDAIAALPNGQVLEGFDDGAALFDPSGQAVRSYTPLSYPQNVFRTVAVDPGGSSFWLCCGRTPAIPPSPLIFQLDLASGQILSQWSPPQLGDGIAGVYGPPLLGDANVEAVVDSNPSGRAEAFSTPVHYSGPMSSLNVYLDASSAASSVIVGVYSNRDGHPDNLLGTATITSPVAGSWNEAQLASPVPVTAGQRIWIAVLGPSGGGVIHFRDALTGAGSQTSAQHNLTALPAKWSTGADYADGRLSAYGD